MLAIEIARRHGAQALQGDGIEVTMTMTTPSCPLGEMILDEARSALHDDLPRMNVHIELVWDPPWSPERMSEEARRQLGLT